MSSDVTYRCATPVDLPGLVELCAEHAAYEEANYSQDGKCDALRHLLFSDSPKLWIIVAEESGALLGFCSFSYEVSTWDAWEYAHMDCLYLREPARGRGIGANLVEAVQKAARGRGVTMIQWQTPPWNKSAIRFYRRIGATTKDKVRCYLPVDR